ncbi:MAG: DUF3313 family protein [Candidatus Binataceae bacterium]
MASLAVALAGCSAGAMHPLKPGSSAADLSPPPVGAAALTAGYLPDPARMMADKRYPFEQSWVQPGVNFKSYSEVVLAPISLEHLVPLEPGKPGDPAPDNRTPAVDAAISAGEAFSRAVHADPARRLAVVAHPGAKTIVVAMAIVALVPSHLDTPETALGLATAAASASSALQRDANLNGRGSIGMEMELRDGRSNQVIAIFADSRRAKTPAGNGQLSSGYGFANQIVGEWMRQTVAMLNS